MIQIRGANSGKNIKIGQMSNDWISDAQTGEFLNPTSYVYSLEEIQRLKQDKSHGVFWYMFHVVYDKKLLPSKYVYRMKRIVNDLGEGKLFKEKEVKSKKRDK